MEGRLNGAVAEIRRAVRHGCVDLEAGSDVMVACSGGADSLALAAAVVFEGRSAGWRVGAAVVDHQLQPGSAEVAAAVRERLTSLGCSRVEVLTVEVGTAGGPEAAARSARYDALSSLAEERDSVVLLGHTLDDQAETVLLGLARGSGLRSLSGMPSVRGAFRRPLLGIRRARARQACLALGVEVWDDPANTDIGFTRVRVRQSVLPVLERELGPRVAEALARTASQARADADALDVLSEELRSRALSAEGALAVDVLEAALPAVRRRALRRYALAAGCPPNDLTAGHVDEIDKLVTAWHGQCGVDLPGHLTARRSAGLLELRSP